MRVVRVVSIAVASLSACSMHGVPATLDPAVAGRAVEETAPDRPLRVVFRWQALDGEARFSGEGVARIEPPYRARLDLFGAHGEGYLSAALVDLEVRLPGQAEGLLPPAAMMWSVLGVVYPPDGATLEGTRDDGSVIELHYATRDGRLLYVLEEGRLRSVDWRGERRVMVELNGVASGLPATAAYRDWSGNTELHIELETVEEVDPYPPEIWTPGR